MNKTFYAFLLLGLITIVSCKRNDCTDIDATNYNSKATSDDNSCTYTGDAIVWFDDTLAQQFIDSNIFIVHFFIDSIQVGAIDVTSFTGIPPSCGSPKGMTIPRNMKKLKTKEYVIQVTESDSTLISTHTITYKANTCTPFKLPN
jgi:hypothetical protein